MAKLRPADPSIPDTSAVAYQDCILIACIAPLTIVHPLLTATYLYPAAAYTLLSVRAIAWRWEDPLAPLMTWLRASLLQTCTSTNSLPPLEMANHITVGCYNHQRQLVPHTAVGPPAPSPTYIMHQAQQAYTEVPVKKKTPAEHWDLQASEIFRPSNVPGPEELPDIWYNLVTLTKKKA